MNITPVLLSVSGLIGATVGLRFKALTIVPVALLIAFISATVLHRNGFELAGGIVVIIGCLVLNQAAYIMVQILGLGPDHSIPSTSDVADGVPGSGR